MTLYVTQENTTNTTVDISFRLNSPGYAVATQARKAWPKTHCGAGGPPAFVARYHSRFVGNFGDWP
jgi:hypothetical protein